MDPVVTLPSKPGAIGTWPDGFILGDVTYGVLGATAGNELRSDNWGNEQFSSGVAAFDINRGRQPGLLTTVNAGTATIVLAEPSVTYDDVDDWQIHGRVTVAVDDTPDVELFVGYLESVEKLTDDLTGTTSLIFRAVDLLGTLNRWEFSQFGEQSYGAQSVTDRINSVLWTMAGYVPDAEPSATYIETVTDELASSAPGSLLAAASTAAAAAGGWFWIDKAGNPTFKSLGTLKAAAYYTSATVLTNFRPTPWRRSSDRLVNDVTVTGTGTDSDGESEALTGRDAEIVDVLPRQPAVFDTGLSTQSDLDALATDLLAVGLDLEGAWGPIEVAADRIAGNGAADFDLFGALDVTIDGRQLDALISGIAHRWDATTNVWVAALTVDTAVPPN